MADAVWSSGVPFFPPSDRYWRIGGHWYDFSQFKHKHPGGGQILEMARDRFEDCTFVFEAHHHDYNKARKIIRKYEVPAEKVMASLAVRPGREKKSSLPDRVHFDGDLDKRRFPTLLDDDAFYSVLRRRVTKHLKEQGCADGGPTTQCIVLFWLVIAAWATFHYLTWLTGLWWVASLGGITGSWVGAFGHNWVHQPRYKNWGWALLSLDTLGFSSEGWYREHILQHHMYTNTPWDNHFKGSDPFLVTDPTVERSWLQAHVLPYMSPLILMFGVYANYIAHTVELLAGREVWSIGKICLPLHFALMMSRWGFLHGALLVFSFHSVIGMYYFTMALMNHNAEHCMDVKQRNKSRDWGEAQLHSSADWGCEMSFLQAIIYLWLNYHTVHHLFPRTDFSHHPALQRILTKTCSEFGIVYKTGSPGMIWLEMVHSFTTPQSLFREICVYGGGI